MAFIVNIVVTIVGLIFMGMTFLGLQKPRK